MKIEKTKKGEDFGEDLDGYTYSEVSYDSLVTRKWVDQRWGRDKKQDQLFGNLFYNEGNTVIF